MPRNIEFAHKLWAKLGDIPVNDDGEIEEVFHKFEIGTNREHIWHWFEEHFDISVGDEFMSGSDNPRRILR